MNRILIVAKEHTKIQELDAALSREGFICTMSEDINGAIPQGAKQAIDLLLVDLDNSSNSTWINAKWSQLQEIKLSRQLPFIALISKNIILSIESAPYIDDFVVEPFDLPELVTRIKRAIQKTSNIDSGETIRCGDLLIDAAKCEVYLEGGLISLAFKEYELLKFLARNKGRAFSRDALLNEVWGYDYYGGDRTVDVHIRRLRSKIEDTDHIFIDTIRNIGYKFREGNYSSTPENSLISA